jgi:hypothetical protein
MPNKYSLADMEKNRQNVPFWICRRTISKHVDVSHGPPEYVASD